MSEVKLHLDYKTEDSKTTTKLACVELLNLAAKKFKGQAIVGGVTDSLSIVIPCADGVHSRVHFYDFNNSVSPIATIANRGTSTYLFKYQKEGNIKIHFSQKALMEAMCALHATLSQVQQ